MAVEKRRRGGNLRREITPMELLPSPVVDYRDAANAFQAEHRKRTGYLVCGAKKRGGQHCMATPAVGFQRCRRHGGRITQAQADQQAARRGRYHSALQGNLAEVYARSMVDPDRLALDSELALLDAATADLARSLSELAAAAEGGQAGILAREELGKLRRDVARMAESRAKLVEAAAKMANLLTPAEVAEFGERLMTLVLRHVPEHDRRQAIARDFEGLMVGSGSVFARLPVGGARLDA